MRYPSGERQMSSLGCCKNFPPAVSRTFFREAHHRGQGAASVAPGNCQCPGRGKSNRQAGNGDCGSRTTGPRPRRLLTRHHGLGSRALRRGRGLGSLTAGVLDSDSLKRAAAAAPGPADRERRRSRPKSRPGPGPEAAPDEWLQRTAASTARAAMGRLGRGQNERTREANIALNAATRLPGPDIPARP